MEKNNNSDELWRCRYKSLFKASIIINNSHDNILRLPNNYFHLPNIPKLKKNKRINELKKSI